MILSEANAYGNEFLKSKGIESYKTDTAVILMHILKCSRVTLLTSTNMLLTKQHIDEFKELLSRRSNGEPVAYITQLKEFMSLNFHVDKRVLIPRGDTEILVTEVLKHINDGMLLLDICTGSGCIPISVCKLAQSAFKRVNALGVDISKGAIEVAIKNRQQLNANTSFIYSDLFNNINESFVGNTDIITSNPPYIETAEIPKLANDVCNYEPHLALDGGDDGLKFYKTIISEAYKFLKPSGILFLEIGYNQSQEVISLMHQYKNVQMLRDLSDKPRVVFGIK